MVNTLQKMVVFEKNAAGLPRKNPKVHFGFAEKLMVKQCFGLSHGRFLYHVC